MKKKQKYYVVWYGFEPGIYKQWSECKKQIDGYKGAAYKSFDTLAEAEDALSKSHFQFIGEAAKKTIKIDRPTHIPSKPLEDSFCVDGACSGNPGIAEYRGVDTVTGAEIFRQGPYAEGTNNLMEFLAIVHALAFCKQRNLDFAIYSDSKIAINWVLKKEIKTALKPSILNQKLFEHIKRALNWLNHNSYPNKILKWETKYWGENPADFGRK
ncbi:MAG TPA: ribonuclease H family protein [Chitinophagaceae bacterium]|nr:ribonuclease H family protein [Chitinophagaceae bacterium]